MNEQELQDGLKQMMDDALTVALGDLRALQHGKHQQVEVAD